MATLQIIKYPDEFLLKISKPVTEFGERLHTFLDDMRETMHKARGMGLAGVQVGKLWRVCIVATKDGVIELVNPEIIYKHRQKKGEEGCLSAPNEYADIKRYHIITVTAKDRHGNESVRDFSGMEAVCIQHEIDHMNGILIKRAV